MRSVLLAIFLLSFTTAALAEIKGEEVAYQADGTTLKGYLAYDDAVQGKRPGILVVHEWWGLNDYARQRARMLAELGYTALAVDMYGQGKTAAHPEDAKKFSGELRQNLPLAKKRFTAGMEVLQQHPSVNADKIAAIGYCFGGGVVLEMARTGLDLDGVVSFHGSLGTDNPATAEKVKARVLVLNGAADPFVTPAQIAEFNREMAAAEVGYRFVNYRGAKHSFTNPQANEYGRKFNLPLAYDAGVDRRSWQEMREFLTTVFEEGK